MDMGLHSWVTLVEPAMYQGSLSQGICISRQLFLFSTRSVIGNQQKDRATNEISSEYFPLNLGITLTSFPRGMLLRDQMAVILYGEGVIFSSAEQQCLHPMSSEAFAL